MHIEILIQIYRGFLALILTVIAIEEPTRNTVSMQQLAEVDLFGSAIWGVAIVCLVLALSWGGSTYREYKCRLLPMIRCTGVNKNS